MALFSLLGDGITAANNEQFMMSTRELEFKEAAAAAAELALVSSPLLQAARQPAHA